MRKHRLSDADVTAILNGNVQDAREDLRILANAVDAIRVAYSDSEPRPSAELAARLDLDRHGVAVPAGELPARTTTTTRAAEPAAPGLKRGKLRMIFSWLTGLGLAAKIGIGATAAVAVGVGAGAAGVLPPPVQEVFLQVVEGTSHAGEEQSETSNELGSDHGDTVSEVARDRQSHSTGKEHGEAVRDVASVKGQEMTEELPKDVPQGPPVELPEEAEQRSGERGQAEQRP